MLPFSWTIILACADLAAVSSGLATADVSNGIQALNLRVPSPASPFEGVYLNVPSEPFRRSSINVRGDVLDRAVSAVVKVVVDNIKCCQSRERSYQQG